MSVLTHRRPRRKVPGSPIPRRLLPWGLVLLLACAFVAPLACAGAAPPEGLEYIPPAPGSYELPPIEAAVDGPVLDFSGGRHRLFDYLGDRDVLLSFIYTRCTETEGCPLATGILSMVQDALASEPPLAARVRLISLSFDPDHDTPEVMRRYAEHGRLVRQPARPGDLPWVFLTTASAAEIRPLLDGYGQSIVREVDERGAPTGTFSHVLKVFLIDRRRRVRNIYSTSFLHPAIAVNDLKTLWMEDARAR